jgi:hypothetical protein
MSEVKVFENEEQLLEWVESAEGPTCVVFDRWNEPLLVFFGGEEGEFLCYQGVPEAMDEAGTEIDPGHGRVERLAPTRWPLRPVWPVL